MPVLKQANIPPSIKTFSMADIEKAATALLLRARQQADQILAAARTEAQKLTQDAKLKAAEEGKRAGYQAGHTSGLAEGKKQGHDQAYNEHKAQLTQLTQSLAQAITALESHRVELETKAPSEVIDLSCAIARRVTKRHAEIDPAVLEANVREAMKLVVKAGDITIFVNPHQDELLHELLPTLQTVFPIAQHCHIEPDPAVAHGGCRIVTADGEVDTTIDTQLDRLIDEVMPRRDE